MERKKLKIELQEYIPPIEPPPFICAICKEECPDWWKSHAGRYHICFQHFSPRSKIWGEARRVMSLGDSRQVGAITSVLREIKNECRKR